MADVKSTKKLSEKAATPVTKTEVKTAPVTAAQNAVGAKNTTDNKTANFTETPVKTEAINKEKTVNKPAAKKAAPAKKAVAKTTAVKKAAEETSKKTTRKPRAKKEPQEKVEQIYFQYAGQEILANDIIVKIQEAYKEEKHRISSIKSLRVYVKPEEGKAYYVINDKEEGKSVDL